MIKNTIYILIGVVLKSLWDFLRSKGFKNLSKLSIVIIVSTIVIILITLCDIYDISKKYSFFRTLDFHNINNYFSAVITGIITILAMWFIDNQNKKRWEKESYQKYKCSLIIDLLTNLDYCYYYSLDLQEYSKTDCNYNITSDFISKLRGLSDILDGLTLFYRNNKSLSNKLEKILKSCKNLLIIFIKTIKVNIDDLKINNEIYKIPKESLSLNQIEEFSKLSNDILEIFKKEIQIIEGA